MDINEIGSYASTIGLIISIITMIIVVYVDKKVKRLQFSNLFDKRINKHLSEIDNLQKELILNMPEIGTNEVRIKEILVELLAEFESIHPKLNDSKARSKTKKIITLINRTKKKNFYNSDKKDVNFYIRIVYFFERLFSNKVSSYRVWDIYISTNENYNRIQQVKRDKNAMIK